MTRREFIETVKDGGMYAFRLRDADWGLDSFIGSRCDGGLKVIRDGVEKSARMCSAARRKFGMFDTPEELATVLAIGGTRLESLLTRSGDEADA